MAQITATAVKELREATNISMMECKKALQEAEGDQDEAIKILRARGIAIAGKKALRETNEGLVLTAASSDGNTVSLVQVNCETDFVARNENFRAFAEDLAQRALETDEPLTAQVQQNLTTKITEMGENIVVSHNTRYVLGGPGLVTSYIHLGNMIGVLIEVGCGKQETAASDPFCELVRDLTLHIAACSPRYLNSDEVPDNLISDEKEIYAKQVSDKPAQIIDKIVDGKLKKFFREICLVSQNFVKDPDKSVTDLVEAASKKHDDTISIRRFERYQIGG